MRAFLISFGVVLLIAFNSVVMIVQWFPQLVPAYDSESLTAINLFGLLSLIPALSAGGTALLIHTRRPRRALDRDHENAIWPAALGITAALLGYVFAVTLFIFAGRWIDPFAMALAFVASACIVIVPLQTWTPGLCRNCDFDLRGSLATGRCPECGMPS